MTLIHKKMKLYYDIVLPALTQMFKEATPSADLGKLIESKETLNPGFFMKYYLVQSRQNEITEKYIKKFRLTKMEKDMIRNELALGSAPRGHKNVRL